MKRSIHIVIRKFSQAMALLSVELILLLLAFFLSISTLIIIVRQIFYHNEYAFDEKVFACLANFISDRNTDLMQVFSFGGSQLFLVPAWLSLIFIYYAVRKNKWMAFKMPLIAISNLLLMFGLKTFFNRPRPLIPLLKNVPGLSFPSGHAFMSFIFYGLIIYLIYIHVKTVWIKCCAIAGLVFLILMIGLSRIYLRVHYATDVVAGYCFGMISLVLFLWLLRRIEKYNRKIIPAELNVTSYND